MEAKRALEKLKNEFNENINSHIFLVETNDVERSIADLKDLLQDILSHGDDIIKTQIADESYIELIVVRSEEGMIKNDSILELQSRLKTKPILSDYIAYIIAPAEDMNENSANKLLKTIEDPNQSVIGFLVTMNADLLLPTIKSRCEIVSFMYEDSVNNQQITPEIATLAKKLVLAIEKADHVAFYRTKTDKLIKENTQAIENLIKSYYNKACNLNETKNLDDEVVKFIQKNNDFKVLIQKTKYVNLLISKLIKNANVDLILEKMFFDLKEVK